MIVLVAASLTTVVAAFLIGSIPFGYLIGRFFYRTDLRTQGSGNIGAMNALRTLGKTGGAVVLLLDAIKGFVPVFYVATAASGAMHVLGPFVAAAAVLGHCFSPWLGWKGGKGVATSFGAIFGLSWQAGLVAVGGWILGALLTQYSSVGSMLGSVVASAALWVFTRSPAETLYGIIAALFIIYTHRENLGRLRAGTEGPIGRFKRRA
ncbi:MAG: glycerol-3-phosphate 1-O-acyltransferase PlsY [Candidatus Tumulicola sp.]